MLKAVLFILLTVIPAQSEQYYDVIITAPAGFSGVIAEMVTKGFTQYITYNDDEQATGVGNGINRFYPTSGSFDTPSIAYLRMYESIYNELNLVSWQQVNVLAAGPAGTDLYEIIKNDPIKKAEYQSYTWCEIGRWQ
jgi:hypothetical protein